MVTVSLISHVDENHHALRLILDRYDVEFSLMHVRDFDSRRYHRTDADITIVDLTCTQVEEHPSLIEEVGGYENVLYLDQKIHDPGSLYVRGFSKLLINKMGIIYGKQLEPAAQKKPFTWVVCGGTGATDSLASLFSSVKPAANDVFIIAQHSGQRTIGAIKKIVERSCTERTVVVCNSDKNITDRSIYIVPSNYALSDDSNALFLRVHEKPTNPHRPCDDVIRQICRMNDPKNVGVIVLSGGADASDAIVQYPTIGRVLVQSRDELIVPDMVHAILSSSIRSTELPLSDIARIVTRNKEGRGFTQDTPSVYSIPDNCSFLTA